MRRLERLYFLIHGFCYAEMAYGRDAGTRGDAFSRYVQRERTCAQKWHSQLAGLLSTDGLVIVPWPGNSAGPVAAYNAFAASTLGDRCFILDCPDCLAPDFWSQGGDGFREAVLREFQAACVHQQLMCNKEEFVTDLHCLACCWRLERMLRERGYSLDENNVSAESWGASFDGCVTKYTVTLRRILGFTSVIEINFGLTVPDASFLLDVTDWECALRADGLRLFLFRNGRQLIALYILTAHSMADSPLAVSLPAALSRATVKSKQGIRLWPRPEPYVLPSAPLECREPAQQLVTEDERGLRVPVSAGFVYRLAKAPAYIFAPPEMSYREFRDLLMSAELVAEGPPLNASE